MRIERLEIDGFGRFHDATWEFGEGLTVLLGANEAGKTTLLNALRALLFGFEATRDGRTWYPALAGGRRGGRLRLRTARGETWTVERHGERGGPGALAVRAPSGNQGGQETLDRLLHGADRDLFNNIFAFGLGELQTFSSLSADGVRGRIYGAGAGLGGTSAIDLERSLRKQLDDVFLPRGRERSLNQILVRIEELRGEIADLSRQPREHADAHRERESLRGRAEELRHAVREQRERASRLARLLDARAPAAQADLLATELADGDPDLDTFPADAVAVVERRETALGEARRALAELDGELSAARAEHERLSPDEAALAAAQQIIAVRDARTARAGATERRRELEAGIVRHAHAVDEQVSRAGALDESRLLALDVSIAAVERTRELEQSLVGARTVAAEAERRARVIGEDLAVREREVAPAGGDDTDAADRLSALDELDALQLHRAVAEARATGGLPPVASAAVAIALGLAALLVGAAAGQAAIGAALGALLAVIAWVVVRRLASPGSNDLPELDAARAEILARAGLPAGADDAAVRRLRTELAVQLARGTLATDHRAVLDARRVELAAARREVEGARTTLAEAESDWRAWLIGAGLPEGLSPEVARQVLSAAGVARRAAVERDDHRRRLAEADADDVRHASLVDDVARRLGMPAPTDAPARDAFVVGVAERLETARDGERRRSDLDAALERLSARRAAAHAALAEREAELVTYLARTGCPDADALRARARQATLRREMAARLGVVRANLAGMAGGADAVDELIADALRADPAELEASRAEAAEQGQRLEEEEREILNRIGALDAQIAGLERAEELGERRQQLATLVGRAEVLAREWTVRALALRLLAETRSRYERERQPDVVRAASEHFARITEGRYARVVAPPGEGDVRVETEGGEARGTDQLSRGTVEQLYLSLRFGLIEEFARGAEPLPVVMDDILVNFDVDRAARAAAAVRDLADRHQVLYFTCHRHVAELLDPGGARTLALD